MESSESSNGYSPLLHEFAPADQPDPHAQLNIAHGGDQQTFPDSPPGGEQAAEAVL